ncbi:MAG: hypothetical protein GVY19_02415 [Bacteroidetes bacterium]|jgi:hypothetical protein|nr:hypothetical protein [Bacteroidota bacterium]
MVLSSILYALLLSILIAALFFYVIKIKGPWQNYWMFAVVLFLFILGTAVWINPKNPTISEIHWIPPIIAGFVVAFLLASATPSAQARRSIEKEYEQQNTDSRAVAVSIFFWILMLLLFGLIITGMIYQPL